MSRDVAGRVSRATVQLRDGLHAAVEALGTGCLIAPENRSLRDRLNDGRLSARDFARELLRLAFRLVVASMVDEAQADDARTSLDLYDASLSDECLREVIRLLTGTIDVGGLRGADLGNAYESLLDLTPEVDVESRGFRLVATDESERKATGTYYTPRPLIDALLDSTLEPVVRETIAGVEPIEAERRLLSLTICDPACGCGHFLIAASERLAAYLARLRASDGEPSVEDILRAKRDVIGRCLFGIDIDPLAVEICRWSLWLETRELADAPASLDANIHCGDSLLGPQSELRYEYFAVVLGNPPWVSYSGRQRVALEPRDLRELVGRFPAVSRWPAAHSAFFLLASRTVREGGRVGLVLPLQVADLDAYRGVREAVTGGLIVESVVDVGEDAFDGVTQPAGLYSFRRSPEARASGAVWTIRSAVGIAPRSVVRVAGSDESELIADLVERLARFPRFRPKMFTDPGVHTGNVAERIVLADNSNDSRDLRPVREGRDITAYVCGPPRKWLWVAPELAAGEYCRIGSAERYADVPILLRQTASRPIAARHRAPTYFRNSLLACAGVDGVSDLVVMAFLNSALYACLHRSRVRDSAQKAFPQVKVGHLQTLPSIPSANLTRLEDGATLAERLHDEVRALERSAEECGAVDESCLVRIERLVLSAFGLAPDLAPALLQAVR